MLPLHEPYSSFRLTHLSSSRNLFHALAASAPRRGLSRRNKGPFQSMGSYPSYNWLQGGLLSYSCPTKNASLHRSLAPYPICGYGPAPAVLLRARITSTKRWVNLVQQAGAKLPSQLSWRLPYLALTDWSSPHSPGLLTYLVPLK